jgi:hypothetical protein
VGASGEETLRRVERQLDPGPPTLRLVGRGVTMTESEVAESTFAEAIDVTRTVAGPVQHRGLQGFPLSPC